MCEILTSAAIDKAAARSGEQSVTVPDAVKRRDSIAADMGDALRGLFNTAKKADRRASLAADIGDSLRNLFDLKDGLETGKTGKAEKSKRQR